MERNREYLENILKAVSYKLKGLSRPFAAIPRPRIYTSNTDGWYVDIGRFWGYGGIAIIMLDKFAGHDHRTIYYGVSAYRKKEIEVIVNHGKKIFGTNIVIENDDTETDGKLLYLRRSLAKSKFGQPVAEYYDRKEFAFTDNYYGIYEIKNIGLARNEIDRMAIRIVGFYEDLAASIAESEPEIIEDEFPKVENRVRVSNHKMRERNSLIAKIRKQKDDYKCQICSFDYQGTYGEEIGANFAEAHHKIPLGKLKKKVVTSIDDLITVCANCHRMLHRLDGHKEDISKLKRIISTHKRTKRKRK